MGGYGHDNRPSDAGFGPVRATGLVDEIVEQLEKAILEGRLRPGDRVVEAALARTMGVSRAPVREAARILAERGLLNQLPRRGFFVRGMTLKEIDDIFDMIAALTHHALHDGGSGDMTKADEISLYVNQIGSGLAPSDDEVQIETELHLLRLVSLLSNNNRLCEALYLIATELKIAARLNPAQPLSKKMLGEYGTLSRAIKAGDMSRAQALLEGLLSDMHLRFRFPISSGQHELPTARIIKAQTSAA